MLSWNTVSLFYSCSPEIWNTESIHVPYISMFLDTVSRNMELIIWQHDYVTPWNNGVTEHNVEYGVFHMEHIVWCCSYGVFRNMFHMESLVGANCCLAIYGAVTFELSLARLLLILPKKNVCRIRFFNTFFFREIRKISNCSDRAETFQKVASRWERP